MPPLSPIDRILIAAAGLLAPQLFAGQLAATTIEFAPPGRAGTPLRAVSALR